MIRRLFIPHKSNKFRPYSLRKPALVIYTLFLLAFNLGYSAYFPNSVSQVAASSITAATLISLTNAERQNLGLTTLKTDARLTAAAFAKANDMIAKDYWNHFGPNGETPWQFITGAGYTYIYAGENLAKGFSTSEGVHQAWMASPTHRANVVNSNYRDIGIAVVEGELLGEQTTLVVQMFGAQSSSSQTPRTPQPSGSNTPLPVVQDEEGEIKSISITKPEEGSVIREDRLEVEGEIVVVEKVVGSYRVKISEGEIVLGEVDSAETTWEVSGNEFLEDGEHELTARVEQDDKKFEDSVKFTLDSTPPAYKDEDLEISYLDDSKEWQLQLIGSEVDMTATIQIGAKPYPMVFTENGYWELVVDDSDVANHISVKLLLSDKLGNVSENEILGRFIKPVQDANAIGTVSGASDIERFTGFLAGIPLKSEVNVLFGLVILGLISLQVYHYYKLGKLSERGGYLLTVTIWVFLIMAGAFVGTFGAVV